eukprot:461807-Lingulodinium_polyedra.AAC.1
MSNPAAVDLTTSATLASNLAQLDSSPRSVTRACRPSARLVATQSPHRRKSFSLSLVTGVCSGTIS